MKPLSMLLLPFLASAAAAQVPNPSFEQGAGSAPDGWKLSSPAGEWAVGGGHTGARCVSVTGNGKGDSSCSWRCDTVKFDASKTWRVSFWTRCASGTTGSVISGPSFANRDLTASERWERKSYVFATPTMLPKDASLRFGHWEGSGAFFFDDIALCPVQPVHARTGGLELGEGETMQDGVYRFRPNFGGDGGNYARPLVAHTAHFNSNRWCFGEGSYVIYRHRVLGRAQRKASATVQVCYHTGGKCMVEVSFDMLTWTTVGELAGVGERTIEFPAKLLPAADIYVRLRGERAEGAGGVNFQVHGYSYEATFLERMPDGRGATHFVEVVQGAPALNIVCESLGQPLPGGDHNAIWRLRNESPDPVKARAMMEVVRGGKAVSTASKGLKLLSGIVEQIELGYDVRDAGEHELRFSVQDLAKKQEVFAARASFNVPQLFASDYGWKITEDEKAAVGLWWCEPCRKVSRGRPEPSGGARPLIRVSAARNERESFQLVLSPRKTVEKVGVTVTDLRGPRGAKIPAANIEVCRVGYVRVESPTDETGIAADWPDPLPPLAPGEEFTPPVGGNTPLWFTVAVPDGIPAGDYGGSIELAAKPKSRFDRAAWRARVPLRVRVWNFSLPKETRLKTALGLGLGNVKAYHNLTTDEELSAVWDKYMQNFAAHRISPYWPMGPAAIGIEFDKSVTPTRVKLDWTRFDAAAARYLDEFGFNTFRLPLQGLGWGGQGKPWHDGEFGGFKQGTPEYEALWGDYARQLSDHLEQKGWLRKAYLYWYDEPERNDYEFVRKNNEQIKRLAPKLTRMLTEEPGPELAGGVDIWCPVSYNFRAESCQERQRAGERVWWYVCCGPRAPWCTLFLDHPAVDLRTWLWQTWGHGVEGILVWETNYWNSHGKFKPPARQNPWDDPMSYTPEGGHWGNGDGRFVYPPNRTNDTKQKFLDGPVSSLRWEVLRDGVEDYEYFALLRDLVKSRPDREAEALLKAPASVFTDMTHFSLDPTPMLEHREKLARAIERLNAR